MLVAALLSAVVAMAQPGPAPARPPEPVPQSPREEPPEGEAPAVDGVVVTGRPLTEEGRREAESDFVRRQSAPTRRNRLARWQDGICPGVVGWPQTQASYVAERVAEEARAVGLTVGAPGCKPDLLIVVTSKGDDAAQRFEEKYRSFFAAGAKPGALTTGGGGQTVRSFVESLRPVRWWHVSELKGSDGRPLRVVDSSTFTGGPIGMPVLLLEGVGSSRLASAVREDLARALIIVDTSRLKGVTYEALASYLAMVSLAQLDPEADPGPLPTILSLFRDRDQGVAPPETLSDWDRAYLRGLYAAPDNAQSLNTQRGAIRRSLSQVGAPE